MVSYPTTFEKILVFNLAEAKGPIQVDEFKEIVNHIAQISQWTIEARNDRVVSYLTKTGSPGTLELAELSEGGMTARASHPCLILTLQHGDRESYLTIRNVLYSLPFRNSWMTYSEYHGCYLPRRFDIFPSELGRWDERVPKLLSKFDEVLVFATDQQLVFTKNPKGEVSLINPSLLFYAISQSVDALPTKELIMRVAPSLSEFSSLFDFGAIPIDFYRYFGRSLRIMNNSGIDIRNPRRKIFVRPFIYQLTKDGRFALTSNQRAVSYMDKIRKGENLDTTLKRILSQDLGIASDFARAVVSRNLEFDLDREGVLTPRLLVDVFVDEYSSPEYAERLSHTGWRSLDGKPPQKLRNE